MSKPCIVVAGMGRCGTSLMMQMLDAAGIDCVGPWPAYETSASSIGSFDPVSFATRRDQAIKLIDPANLPVGDMPNHVVIWLDRNPREQAKSQIKFAQLAVGHIPNTRTAIRAMDASLRKGRATHRARVGIPGGCPSITISFEDLIIMPTLTSSVLSFFLAENGWPDLDPQLMATQVRPRSTRCFNGFLEAALLEERGVA